MHRVKSEHGKDDEEDDITDDERKIEQHTAAMQTGNYHRGKFAYSISVFRISIIYQIYKFSGHPHHLQHPPYHHHHHHHTMLSAWR